MNTKTIIRLLVCAWSLCAFNCVLLAAGTDAIDSSRNPLRPSSLGVVGDTTNVEKETKPGLVLMGGGEDVDAAFRWMIEKSGGGNVVIIRSSGTDVYNSYVSGLGKVSSVETLNIDSRELADNDTVVRMISNAEMLFIADGDQSKYVEYWKGTKTADAINYLINKKKVPVGGTGAGCGILGQVYFSGAGESALSKELLADPYNRNVRLYKNDFLHPAYLDTVITDQNFTSRMHIGRHVVFLARLISDWNLYANGIAMDEKTAVCIDGRGKAQVFGSGKAFFVSTLAGKDPEVCDAGRTLVWSAGNKALKVYEIEGSLQGSGNFNVRNFNEPRASGGKWFWWWVNAEEVKQAAANPGE